MLEESEGQAFQASESTSRIFNHECVTETWSYKKIKKDHSLYEEILSVYNDTRTGQKFDNSQNQEPGKIY